MWLLLNWLLHDCNFIAWLQFPFMYFFVFLFKIQLFFSQLKILIIFRRPSNENSAMRSCSSVYFLSSCKVEEGKKLIPDTFSTHFHFFFPFWQCFRCRIHEWVKEIISNGDNFVFLKYLFSKLSGNFGETSVFVDQVFARGGNGKEIIFYH